MQDIVVFFIIYNAVISFLGLRKRKILQLREPKNKFAVIVAAHNEEMVIGELIKNLQNLDYPRHLYKIYVICDNCTDQTEVIVKELHATAMVRNDLELRGKGYALKWMFDQLWQMEKEGKIYDAVAIFDADNLVSQNFLHVMNTKLLEGKEVIQGYLDSKNPSDTLVTKTYAISYWTQNRIWQLSREHLGLSSQLGGTGFVVSTKVIKEIGWNATSLTEDVEYTQLYVLQKNKPVSWAHDAIVYDEKPLTFSAAWKQRVRWMQGHVDCMFRLTGPLLSKAIINRSMLHLDSAIYLLQPSRMILTMLLWLFTLLSFFKFTPSYSIWFYMLGISQNSQVMSIFYLTLLTIIYSLPILGMLLEKKGKVIHWTVPAYLINLAFLPTSIAGFIKRKQKEWVHTKHTIGISIKDITKK